MNLIARGMYVSPPCHGAMIVQTVLTNPDMLKEWKKSIKVMADRMNDTRTELRRRIENLDTPGDWSFITSQIGMFSYTGLTEEMCIFLQRKKHVYLLKSGRISMCGVSNRTTPCASIFKYLFIQVNSRNVDYLARAIHEAVKRFGVKE